MSERAEQTVRFTVSLPRPLLEELDRGMIDRGYASRSEYVRDLIREQLIREKWQDAGGEVVGVLTICYDHHQRELPDRIMQLQHRRYVNVLCTTHVHLDREDCLEAIFLRGKPAEVERLGIEIGGLRGVKFSRLTRASKVDL
ncbi:MAG: nickel-responsive transcriptional regulator NikR [Candidatus Eisenbacteria bacterium]|nr:nickel-responsive transcriptional regulator NikR [Candidatus Latescibacterota bacterium]MBD3300974.1 nickel-responsive transcriptional regulator NikR [Candidatus Eisenbacteria bacterium]